MEKVLVCRKANKKCLTLIAFENWQKTMYVCQFTLNILQIFE